MSKLSDSINITIHREGESTGNAELDGLISRMSDCVFETLKNCDKLTREQADEAFSRFVSKSITETLKSMSDGELECLIARIVKFDDPFN